MRNNDLMWKCRMRHLAFLLLLFSSCGPGPPEAIDEPPGRLTFEVSFDDSWRRIQSYKLSDSGKFSYFQVTINPYDTVNFADTLMGEKMIAAPDLDSITAILDNVIADSLGDKDLMCFDCGRGYLLYNEEEYYVARTSIPSLFRIEKFVAPDSLSNKRIDVASYTTLQRLMPEE